MVWVKLDDHFAIHPKVAGLSDSAFRLHVHALCYAASVRTDGVLPIPAIKQLAWASKSIKADVEQLVQAGLWEKGEGAYCIHDFLKYNPSAQQVNEQREKAKQRMQFARSSQDVRANIARSSDAPHPHPVPEVHNPLNPPLRIVSVGPTMQEREQSNG